MSEIKFECPKCGQHIITEVAYAGIEAQCPTCSYSLIIPYDSSAVNTDSNEVIMYVKTDSWKNILAQLKLIQGRDIKKFTLFNEKNESLSLIRAEHYIATFKNKEETFVTLSTALTFKKVIEIFENFYKIQTINRKKVRWVDPSKIAKKHSTHSNQYKQDKFSNNTPSYVCKKSLNFDWKQFFSMDSKNLGCGSVIIILLSVLFLVLLFYSLGSCSSFSDNSSSNSPSASHTVPEYICQGCSAKSTRPFHGNGNGLDGFCPNCVQKFIMRQIMRERSKN